MCGWEGEVSRGGDVGGGFDNLCVEGAKTGLEFLRVICRIYP